MGRGDTFLAAVNIFAQFLRRTSAELQISEFGELADLSATAFRKLSMSFARSCLLLWNNSCHQRSFRQKNPVESPEPQEFRKLEKQHKNSSSGSTSTICPTSISSVQKEQQTLSIKQRKLPEWKSPTDLIWRQPTIDKGPVHKAARFVSSTAPLPGAAWTTRQHILLARRCYRGLEATSQLSLYRARSFWALYSLSAQFC